MSSPEFRSRLDEARAQLYMLRLDVAVMLAGNRRGLLTAWLRQRFWAVFCYRLERAILLASGDWWPAISPPLTVLLAPLRPPGVEISPRARIGAGLTIYHPALGVVVGPHTEAGERLVLTGGNCIGARRVFNGGERLVIGDRVVLGAGAMVLGPIEVGDDVWLAAGAVIDEDVPSHSIVRRAPATITTGLPRWRVSRSGADATAVD